MNEEIQRIERIVASAAEPALEQKRLRKKRKKVMRSLILQRNLETIYHFHMQSASTLIKPARKERLVEAPPGSAEGLPFCYCCWNHHEERPQCPTIPADF